MPKKVFVEVKADFTADGEILPRSFKWEDGHSYDIDRIINICPGASLKVGGQGVKYTCRIMGKEVPLFLEDNRWFMEGKN
jgi:hypothetical protein